ncbi:IDEAL domain-containing protein [Rossellomorea vietnamensis]|uniref:IDEAL domain-containing protein n=1 Tax=Rossellomorea vietnamensis TaxID=218284 RepID=A0A5D4KA53_9BACI|nr:IDEAL domain-containing protein [Rossellomorea vietnamensis]TYR74261.1 IDEAL domain-containing protein [Rossellomorea vietnamensis]
MNTKKITVGDWVKAKSFEGEIVIGYIENVNKNGKSVRMKAVQDEQDGVKGSSIETPIQSVTPLQEFHKKTKADILELIDLALLTHDKEWFERLTADLKDFHEDRSRNSQARKPFPAGSRLNFHL